MRGSVTVRNLLRAWRSLSYRGINRGSRVEARATMSANNFYVLTGIANIPLALLIMAHDGWSHPIPGLTHLLMVGVWMGALVLNGRGYSATVTTVALVAAIGQFTYLSFVFSRAAGFQYALVVVPSLTFVMFVPKQWPLRLGVSLLALATGLAMYLNKSMTIPQVDITPQWAQRSGALMIVSIAILLIALASFNDHYFQRERERNQVLLDEARKAARTDALTLLANRRGVSPELNDAASKGPYSVAIADLDRFKRVNDAQGHAAGDIVLTEVARQLEASVGSHGVVARWGGEEFLVVMPGLALHQAELVMERARLDLEEHFRTDSPPVTMSVGLVHAPQFARRDNVLRLADLKLYEAKAGGRNVVVASTLYPSVPN